MNWRSPLPLRKGEKGAYIQQNSRGWECLEFRKSGTPAIQPPRMKGIQRGQTQPHKCARAQRWNKAVQFNILLAVGGSFMVGKVHDASHRNKIRYCRIGDS